MHRIVKGYRRKDFAMFKACIKSAVEELHKDGVPARIGKIVSQSPYQKARYKPQYIFPEAWIYGRDGMGICINGEDVNGDPMRVAQEIKNQLQ